MMFATPETGVIGVLALLALLLVGTPIGVALGMVGIGGLALAGLWSLGVQLGSARAVTTDTGNAVANMFRDQFVGAAAADFQSWIAATAVTGGVLVAVGIVTLFASRKRVRASR